MPASGPLRIITTLAVAALFLLSLIASFLAQNTQPSPTPSPQASPSPSASATPTPPRTPSPTPLPGAQNAHRWGSVTVFNGLPSDSVRAIAQTPDGVMWFGTDNGLARFDGRRVQKYPFGKDADQVTALKTSPGGDLWIGTRVGLWVHSGQGFSNVEGSSGTGVTSIMAGAEVYFGTDGGQVFRARRRDNGSLFAEAILRAPIRAADGEAAGVTDLIDAGGRILIATSGGGVFLLEGETASPVQASPRPLFVNSLSIDGDGTLWLGADAARGASGVYGNREGRRIERIAAPTARVLALESNGSDVWAGTERFGLFHIRGVASRAEPYTFVNTSGGLRSDNIFTLFTDREGVLWIGTNRGVSRYDKAGAFQETISEIPNSNFIRTLFRSADGAVYAGSNRGLFVQTSDGWAPVAAHANKPIYALSEDRSGRLTVVTTQNVDRTIFDSLPDAEKIGTIRRVFKAADGVDWIAGERGVFRVSEGRPEMIVAAEDARDVFVDDGGVWAATTSRGLQHARLDEKFGWLVSTIGFEQGLPSDKAFSILPAGDGFLIATNRGVVTYRPGSIEPKLIATRVLSRRVHDLAEIASTIALEYPQNSMLVEVAGQSSRTFPEEFQYAFVLKNGRGDELERRVSNDAQYSPAGLAAGEYAIEAFAFDRDLNRSEPLVVRFSVAKAPFPWTATALGVLLVLALFGLAWAFIEHRRIVYRNRELAAARFDLANEAERERRRIARDLHDQTLADLRALMLKSDRSGDADGFRDDIEAVSTDIRRICEDLSPSALENVGLVAALESLLTRSFDNRSFEAADDLAEHIGLPMNVQLQIYRIAQEVLTNIARHAAAERVDMSVAAVDGDLELSIRDNGRPFDANGSSPKGRGIANIRSRANLINAKIAWRESAADGNLFSLKIAREYETQI